MSDETAPPPSIDWDSKKFEYDRVKTLFDYTKFHIGLYLTLGGALYEKRARYNVPPGWHCSANHSARALPKKGNYRRARLFQ